jgi:hypothetical protein
MGANLAPLLFALALAFAHPGRAPNNDVIAAITVPDGGQRVDGIVHIIGTATHPVFDHYELHFALDPNPTDTWFPIVLAGVNQVEEGQLGNWDTNSISAGTYMLRLHVFSSDEIPPTETIVPRIAVRAGLETEMPTPSATVTATITPVPVSADLPPLAAQRGTGNRQLNSLLAQLRVKHDYRSTFLSSAAYSVTAFLALGFYLEIRKLIRPYVRRLLRRMRSDLRRP